jgi:hypothetical protein
MTSIFNPFEKISTLMKEINDTLQDPYFDSLAIEKKIKLNQKIDTYNFNTIETVYLGFHLNKAISLTSSINYIHLSEDFLLNPPSLTLDNSIFILLNNDVAKYLPQYLNFYNNNPKALIIIWDWDSQHWLNMSSILAVHSDFYIPASSDNLSILSQFSPNVIGPIFACAHQWSKKFILNNLDMLLVERTSLPLGMHVFYENYPRRNRVIATLNSSISSVGFSNNDFKNRSDLQNFQEWAGYKSHWIVPVLSGVPIRVYNGIITGGIPIVPSFYKNLPENSLIYKSVIYYDTTDVINSTNVLKLAHERFNDEGENGILTRVCDALNNHHVDFRCLQIIKEINIRVENIKSGNQSNNFGYIGCK